MVAVRAEAAGVPTSGKLTNPFKLTIYVAMARHEKRMKHLITLLSSSMEENESVSPYKQLARKQGSVPFLWEEKPGTPKREYKLEMTQCGTIPPPVKLVTSVPFKWEEKPGKPLNCFKHPQGDSQLLPVPPARFTNLPSPLLDSPSSSPWRNSSKMSSLFQRNRYDEVSSNSEDAEEDTLDEEEEKEEMFELDFGVICSNRDESFTGSPSLLANCLVPTDVISNAVPVSEYSMEEHSSVAENTASPSSETDSKTSSYMTGTTSLMDSSFFDNSFPLFSPDSGFLDKVECCERRSSPQPPVQIKELGHGSSCSVVVRRTPTLGELIQMSYRSYRSNSIHIQKQSSQREFIKKRAIGCCIF